MKPLLILAFGVLLGYLFFGAGRQSQQTPNANSNSAFVPINYKSTPTPTVPFTLKQQCGDNANTLLRRINSDIDATSQEAQATGHTSAFHAELDHSAYSNRLDTCVALISGSGRYDGGFGMYEEVYDAVSGKTLASHFFPDDKDKNDKYYINGNTGTPTLTDWINYETSVGL